MVSRASSRPPIRLALVVALVTAAASAPTLQNGFVDLDDQTNLIDNPHFRGLGAANVRWMATTFQLGHWQPLSWLSLALDHAVWGMWPTGYHLTSVLLHAANAALLFILARRLLAWAAFPAERIDAAAALGALFWAVHPLRVESVAWATERRDVLSGFFVLVALIAYVREPGGRRRPGLALAATAAALLAKASAMVVPVFLVALDVSPLRRRAWLEKLPFAALAALSALIAVRASGAGGALRSFAEVPLAARLGAAMLGLGFYLWKIVLPIRLLPMYEYPLDMGPLHPLALAGLATFAAVAATAVWYRTRCPALLAALVVYVAAIAPTLGLAQSGPQIAADRYTYLAALGWSVVAGAFLMATAAAIPRAAGAAAVAVLAVLSARQATAWHDARTLWTRAAAIDPQNAFAQYRLGDGARLAGDGDGAIARYREALRLRPAFAEVHSDLGAVLAARGDFDAALAHYREAIRLSPRLPLAHTSLGVALATRGRLAEAVDEHRKALAIDPDYMEAHVNLGSALDDLGRLDEAEREYAIALGLRPSAEAYTDLGVLLGKTGRPAEAIAAYREALRLRPEIAAVHENLGFALAASGDRAGAIAELEATLRLDPGAARARQTLERLRAGS